MGLADVSGVKPASIYKGTKPVRFYGFQIHYLKKKVDAFPKKKFIKALQEEGLRVQSNEHLLLHQLPLFAEGFDIFTEARGLLCTPKMGGDYLGYQKGGFPITEEAYSRLVSLPVFSNPVENC